MKNILSFSLLLISASIFAQVNLSLRNDTGTRLDSLIVQGIYVGTIEKDSIKIVTCKSMEVDSGHPRPTISAIYKNEKVEHYKITECGTFIRNVTKGDYVRKLVIIPNGDGSNFIATTFIANKKR